MSDETLQETDGDAERYGKKSGRPRNIESITGFNQLCFIKFINSSRVFA